MDKIDILEFSKKLDELVEEYRAGMEALHSDIAKKLSGHVKCLDEDTPEALFNAALKDFAQKCTKAVEEITL